jgi:hypothetical protein
MKKAILVLAVPYLLPAITCADDVYDVLEIEDYRAHSLFLNAIAPF